MDNSSCERERQQDGTGNQEDVSFWEDESEERSVKPTKERVEPDPNKKLLFAGLCLLFVAVLYMTTACFYVYSESFTKGRDSMVNVWEHFSNFSTNIVMLILGYYFASKK